MFLTLMGTYLRKHDTWNTDQKDSSNRAQNEILYIKLALRIISSLMHTSSQERLKTTFLTVSL